MPDNQLTDDLLALLKLVQEFGSSVCVGTCEHRKPGELHCHNIGQILKISSNGAKRRLRELVAAGLLNRERAVREDGKIMGKYTVTAAGLNVCADQASLQKKRIFETGYHQSVPIY